MEINNKKKADITLNFIGTATNLRRDKRNEDDESENQVWFAAACREPSCPFGCFNSVEPRAVQRL
ncbi:MAG: hypothetical protein QNJ41_21055, partial [Xenococcaceae cyanobacterium MO_188.B32]|nr:hypothetical protein [Xenococcaceae cyanobacterium MO_188.B32]